MSYKEEPNIYDDPLRKKSAAERNKTDQNATSGAFKSPIEIDKSALGYGLKNDEDAAFVDNGDQSVNILNGFNGEQTQSILVAARDDLMEEDERERVRHTKQETGKEKFLKVLKFFSNLKFFTYNDDNLIQFDANKKQKKTTKCKLFIMIVVAIPLIYLVLSNYLKKLGLEKAQSIKYVSHSMLTYNVSDVPKLLPVHSFTYFYRKEVTDRMKCKINNDQEECLQIEKRRCESEDKTTAAYEDCMITLFDKQENKNSSAFCERHYDEDSKLWVGALSPTLEFFHRRKHACYEKTGIPLGRQYCLDLEEYAGWTKELLFECYRKHRVEFSKEYCDYMFKGNNRQLIQCYGTQGVKKDEAYCNAAFSEENQIGDLINCYEDIKLKDNRNTCFKKYKYYVWTNKEYQTCLIGAGETLNEKFCKDKYPDDRTQLEERYECFKRIGLDIVKDRKFCELKHPQDSAEKYECLERLSLPKGADYCYIEYPWPRQYEEKYECLEQEGVGKTPQYCKEKFSYINKLKAAKGEEVQPVAEETCQNEFGIPMQSNACSANENYQKMIAKQKRIEKATEIAVEKSARFYDSFDKAKNRFYLNQFAQIIANQFEKYFTDARKANRIEARQKAEMKAVGEIMNARKEAEKKKQAQAKAALEEKLRIQKEKEAEEARIKAEQELIQRLTDDLFKILSTKLDQDRPVLKEEIAAILKAEAELAAKLMELEEQEYRKRHEKIIAENIETTITSQIKAFKEEFGEQNAKTQEEKDKENAQRISADIEAKIKKEFEVYMANQKIIIDAIKKETDDAKALAEENAKKAAQEEEAKNKALQEKADAEKTVQEQSDKINEQTQTIDQQSSKINDQTQTIDSQSSTIEENKKTITDEQALKDAALKQAQEEKEAREKLAAELQKQLDAKDNILAQLAQEKLESFDTKQTLAAEEKKSGVLQSKLDEIARMPVCSKDQPKCDKEGYLCVKRTITAIDDIYSQGYQSVSKNDDTMVVGGESFQCRKTQYANELVSLSGFKSKTTTVTATYEFVDEDLHAEQKRFKNEIDPEFDVNGLSYCSAQYPKCDIDKTTGLRKQCVMKYILDVANPEKTEYKNALTRDSTLTKGSEIYRCYRQQDLDAVMALHNKKDESTTITASYRKLDIPQPEDRPSARLAQNAYDLNTQLIAARAELVKAQQETESLNKGFEFHKQFQINYEAKRIEDDANELKAAEERIKNAPLGTCTQEDTTTCEMGQVCITRYVNAIGNPLGTGYVNAYNLDPELARGVTAHRCYYISQKEEILAKTNQKDEETTVTSVYTEQPNKEQSVLTAEEKATQAARVNQTNALKQHLDDLEKQNELQAAKLAASEAEAQRLTIEYMKAKALSEEANPQTKQDQGARRRRLEEATEEAKVETKVDPAENVKEEAHGAEEDHTNVEDHGVDDHGVTDNIVTLSDDDHGETHDDVEDHSNDAQQGEVHDDHPPEDHSEEHHSDDHAVVPDTNAEQQAEEGKSKDDNAAEKKVEDNQQPENQGEQQQQNQENTENQQAEEQQQAPENPPPQENKDEQTQPPKAETTPQETQNNENQESQKGEKIKPLQEDAEPENQTPEDQNQAENTQNEPATPEESKEEKPQDTKEEQNQTQEPENAQAPPNNEQTESQENAETQQEAPAQGPVKDDKQQEGSSAGGYAPIVVNIGEIEDEEYQPFIGLLMEAYTQYDFSDYKDLKNYINQIKRFELDMVRRSEQNFYAVYNHSMKIDGDVYLFDGKLHQVNVEDTWVQYMKPQKYTMSQIMGEMTDLDDIIGDLSDELDLSATIGEEELTADLLRDNTGKTILDKKVPFNITQLLVDASILNQAKLVSDEAIADSVKLPESCQGLEDQQAQIAYCEENFSDPSQIEIKTACLEKFGVEKTPEYCLQTLRVTHESFYYPTKNKYQCLTAASNPFVVAIDDDATKCLNRYFDYAVETCLLEYEKGNNMGFRSDKMQEYGILSKQEEQKDPEPVEDGLPSRRLLEEKLEDAPFTDQEIEDFLCSRMDMQFYQNPLALMPVEDQVIQKIDIKKTETKIKLKCNSFSFRDKGSSVVHYDSVVHFYIDEIKDDDSILLINRTEANLNELKMSFEPDLEFLEIIRKKLYLREQKLDADLDAPVIKDQDEFFRFKSDGSTVKLFETTKQVLFEQQMPVISLLATPVKNEYIGKKPDKSIFGLVVTFMDQLQQLIKIDSELEKRQAIHIPIAERDRTVAQTNKIHLFFKFSETQMRFEYFNIMDILTQLGGIAATINLTIGNLSVLFVIIYMTDLVNMIYKGYHSRYAKYKAEFKLQNLEKIGHIIQLIKNMKGNQDDSAKITKNDAIPSLITQEDLDRLTMKELNEDLEMYGNLLVVKQKTDKRKMKNMKRGESHVQIEDSDDDLNHIEEKEIQDKYEQVLKDYDYLSKKYGKFVYIDEEDISHDNQNLFEEKSVNFYVLASRMRQNFFQIASEIKKRVSFYGIYESTDKIEITQQKLKHLRSQVEMTTTHMLEQIKIMNMEIEKRQTDKEITKYKKMIQEVYLKFIEQSDPTKELSLEKEESILMGENLDIQKVRTVLDRQLTQVQKTQRALALAGLQNPNNFMEEMQNMEQKLDDKIEDKPKLFKRDKNRSSTIKSMLKQSQKKTGMKVVSNEEEQ